MRLLPVFLMLSLSVLLTPAYAQDETLVDKFRLDMSGLWGGWHFQVSPVGGENAFLNGGYGGIEFNKVLFVGYGAYRGNTDVAGPTDGLGVRIDYRYHGPVIAYTPLARSVIHPKAQFMLGFADFESERFLGGVAAGRDSDDQLVLQPSLGGEINVLRWARLGLDLGYRFSAGSRRLSYLSEDSDGFFASATLKFGFSWGTDVNGLEE